MQVISDEWRERYRRDRRGGRRRTCNMYLLVPWWQTVTNALPLSRHGKLATVVLRPAFRNEDSEHSKNLKSFNTKTWQPATGGNPLLYLLNTNTSWGFLECWKIKIVIAILFIAVSTPVPVRLTNHWSGFWAGIVTGCVTIKYLAFRPNQGWVRMGSWLRG